MEKVIWQGLIQISQNGPVEAGFLDILKSIPSNDIQDDVRHWFRTEDADQKTIDVDFSNFLQQRATGITHSPPTTPSSILPISQTSLDIIQKSSTWQQLGLDPCVLTNPSIAPRTPPLTPTLSYPINDTPSPTYTPPSSIPPHTSSTNVYAQMGQTNCRSPPLDRRDAISSPLAPEDTQMTMDDGRMAENNKNLRPPLNLDVIPTELRSYS